MYLEYFSGDLNPADSLPRVDSNWSGRFETACLQAQVRYKALEAYPDVRSPVWVLGFSKGRRGAATNLESSALGSAEPLRGGFFFMRMLGELLLSLECGFLGPGVVRILTALLVRPFGESGEKNSVGDRNMPEYSCFAL